MKSIHIPAALLLCLSGISGHSKTAPADADSLNKKPVYRASTTLVNDIIHTRLDVKFDWTKAQMEGKASITAKPYFKPTSKLVLNARGMQIHSVDVYELNSTSKTNLATTSAEAINSNKLQSSYNYKNDSLTINLGREFKANEKYMVNITYTARPNELKKGGSDAISDDKGLFFINPKGDDKHKMPQIWTQGETMANSAWFPTVDSPNEKMTDEIYMTVDQKYATLSNGLLTDTKKNADGTKTDHWKMDLPHSPYLVMMAVGEFKKVTDAPWNGKEISYYVEKEYEPYAKAIFGNTKEMIDFYSKVLQTPYPWQKYAQIVVRDYVSGAMENTSATLHGDFMVYQTPREMLDEKKGEDVIAHELFHQWFGDLTTAESWSNLPLNESFATYGEYLWEEYKNGRDAADAHSFHSRQGYFSQARQKQVNMIRFDYESQEDMFDAFSYNKGGQILHMLRKYVGDDAFFTSLKLYLEKNKFKSAEIHNLRLAFEEVTGEDLNWFFNEWFLEKGHPVLEITKRYDDVSKTVKLSVKQTQSLSETPLYTLPVDVDIYSAGKKERHRIIINQAEQEFSFASPVNPDLVNFDAERQLLALRTYTKTTDEFVFQYQNAGLFSDRNEALGILKDNVAQDNVYKLILTAAEKDNWWELRQNAIAALKPVAAAKEAEIKPLMMRIAITDKNTNVRSMAIEFLATNYKGADLEALYVKALNEQSYSVNASALEALGDSQTAMQKAKALENEKNLEVYAAIAAVYAKYGSDDNSGYFVKAKEYFSNYDFITYINRYGKFLKRCNNPASFETAAVIFSELIKTGNTYVSDFTKKAFKENIIDELQAKQEALKDSNPAKSKEFEALKVKLASQYSDKKN